MTPAQEMRKDAVLSSLLEELRRWDLLESAATDRGMIVNSRRKIMGYCDELDAFERMEAKQ